MKYLASFLVMILMLSASVPGIAGARKDCQSNIKSCLHTNCCKETKHSTKNDCPKTGCICVLSCCNCGVIKSTAIANPSFTSDLSDQHRTPFVIGDLSDYKNNNWNPPKA